MSRGWEHTQQNPVVSTYDSEPKSHSHVEKSFAAAPRHCPRLAVR